MALDKEVYEQLPDAVKSDYEEKDGQFYHVSEGKAAALKQSLDNFDAKYKSEVGTLQSQIDEINAKKEQEIKDAREAALAEAKNKGDVDAIEQRYQEQMADLEKRVQAQTRAEVEKEFHTKSVDNQIKSAAELFAQLAVDDDSKSMLELFAKNRMKNEDGKMIFLNADGSASSVTDAKQFLSELKSDPAVKRLVKADNPVSGGGLANGGSKANTPEAKSQKAEDARKKNDLHGYLKNSITL